MKNSVLPILMLKREALLRRIPPSHPEFEMVAEDLRIAKTGYSGEQSIDYHLQLLDREYLHFYDLRLPSGNGQYFQIDILLLAAERIILLEVKNMAGTLFFDEDAKQLVRTIDDKMEAFPYPLTQTRRHRVLLQGFLRFHGFPPLPIENYVVLARPASLLRTLPEHRSIYETVVHAAALPFKINALPDASPLLSDSQISSLTRLLLGEDTPFDANILKKYSIRPSDIRKGIYCRKCRSLSVARMRGSWTCTRCSYQSKDAHMQALLDYSLLHSRTITNRQFRDFLQLDSPSIASKLLDKLPFQSSGQYKNRCYKLDVDYLRKWR